MMHQDDLQFWLLEHKNSKSHVLSRTAIIIRLKQQIDDLYNAEMRVSELQISPQEALQTALSISTSAFILAEKTKL